jgi:hypothetical protein
VSGIGIVGIVLVAIGAILYLIGRSQAGKLRQMVSVETSTAKELADLARSVRQDLEQLGQTGGGFSQVAEVKGVLRADYPLTSEIGKQPCVYYKSTVTREYEESYWETDSQTNQRVQRTRRSSETVSDNSQRTDFWVEDSTGRIRVDPEGADMETTQAVDRFEPAGAGQGGSVISFGEFRIDVGGFGGGPGTRTLGYRFKEQITPADRRIYVLGEAIDVDGEVVIQKPRQGGKRFMISLKSEEDLVKSTGSTVKWMVRGAVGCGLVGIVLVIVGLVR